MLALHFFTILCFTVHTGWAILCYRENVNDYRICTIELPLHYETAAAICRLQGYRLLNYEDDPLIGERVSLKFPTIANTWLGYRKRWCKKDQHWRYGFFTTDCTSELEVNTLAWQPGEPSGHFVGYERENCVELSLGQGDFQFQTNDVRCWTKRPAICVAKIDQA